MITVKNIVVSFSKRQVIKKVSFQVKEGAVVGLIGPNGAGKTTIMKTILGLLKFEGAIQINGSAVTVNNHQALTKVGALIERPAIYPFLTGRQNLTLYCKNQQDVLDLVTSLEMTAYVDDKSKQYSLKKKKKLGIAIALLNQPEFVILDEPMNGLDIEATILVRQIIKKYADGGTSFLISSHILSELEKVITDVVLINNGEILVEKPITELIQNEHQQYKLVTNNLAKTVALLDANGIKSENNETYLMIDASRILEIQPIIYAHGIQLLELSPITIDFEEVVVNVLKEREVNPK